MKCAILLVSNLVCEEKCILRRFIFRLQTLLNLKEKKLEDERRVLAELLSVYEEQKEVLAEMKQRQEELEIELENEQNVHFMQNYQNYISRLSQDIKVQIEIIEKTKKEVEIQKLKVQEAYKELKVLEKLKEKEKEKFDFEFRQMEIKELDDINSSRQKKVV